MALMGPGTYRINPLLFRVELANAIDIPDNKVGIVTTREGCALAKGEIAGLTVEGHNLFQTPRPSSTITARKDCKSRSCWRAATSSTRGCDHRDRRHV